MENNEVRMRVSRVAFLRSCVAVSQGLTFKGTYENDKRKERAPRLSNKAIQSANLEKTGPDREEELAV